MADPATLAIAAGIMGGVGGGLQTISQVQALRAQSKFASKEAESIQETAAAEEAGYRRESERVLAKRMAIGAAAGLDIGEGSPLVTQLDAVREAELNALTIRHRGTVAAKAKQFESQLYRKAIPGVIASGATGAGSSVLGGFMKAR